VFDASRNQSISFHLRLATVNGDKSQQIATTAIRGSNADSFCGTCDITKDAALSQSYRVNVREFRRTAQQVNAVYEQIAETKSREEKVALLIQHGLKAEQVCMYVILCACVCMYVCVFCSQI
jgi:hypothetical protein